MLQCFVWVAHCFPLCGMLEVLPTWNVEHCFVPNQLCFTICCYTISCSFLQICLPLPVVLACIKTKICSCMSLIYHRMETVCWKVLLVFDKHFWNLSNQVLSFKVLIHMFWMKSKQTPTKIPKSLNFPFHPFSFSLLFPLFLFPPFLPFFLSPS